MVIRDDVSLGIDDKGEETTAISALPGQFEHHITADIAIAFWHFYNMTQDKDWLIKETATVF